MAFTEPQLEVLDLEPVSFKAVVPLEPTVDLGDLHSIRLQPTEVEIGDEDVTRVLESLQYESAPWEPADRPVVFGDLVTMNVRGAVAGEDVINDEGVDYIPQLDNNLPVPGFSVYIEGMTEGQEKEFSLPLPEESIPPDSAASECYFHVEVISVKEKKLPELDDEFAKGVREGFDDMEALSEHIRQRLTEDAEATALRELERNSLEEVKKIATIQASELIYQREMDSIREDHERTLRNQRLDMDTYLRFIGQTEQEWEEQLRPQAEDRLTTFLVLRKLAEQEEVEVEPSDRGRGNRPPDGELGGRDGRGPAPDAEHRGLPRINTFIAAESQGDGPAGGNRQGRRHRPTAMRLKNQRLHQPRNQPPSFNLRRTANPTLRVQTLPKNGEQSND